MPLVLAGATLLLARAGPASRDLRLLTVPRRPENSHVPIVTRFFQLWRSIVRRNTSKPDLSAQYAASGIEAGDLQFGQPLASVRCSQLSSF